jgi:hypothetical protein
MARSLASYGNIVVLIDHPYDPPVVEFPDGKIIKGGNIPDDAKSNQQLGSVCISISSRIAQGTY